LAFKEARENLWIGAAGLAILLFVVANQIGWDESLTASYGFSSYGTASGQIPFVADDFAIGVAAVAALLAVALGFHQTLGETLHGTYLLLFHLPVSRRRLVWFKLAAGLTVYVACTVPPVLLFAVWAATPGTHASPFAWSMTWPVWRILLSMTMLYLAAFLCGLRPARWFGSRLLPLVVAAMPTFILLEKPLPWWWLPVLITVVVDGIFLVCIQHVVRVRDFS
jgi:hypothetical protein